MNRTEKDIKEKELTAPSVTSLDSMGKRKTFARLITRFAEKTSISGVPYINHAKLRLARVIWSILLVIALGMMVVHLWYLSNQYFKYPKITKLSLGYDNLPFPHVTICNTNPLHKGRFDAFDGATLLKELMHDMKPENLVPDQFDPNYDPTVEKKADGNSTSSSGVPNTIGINNSSERCNSSQTCQPPGVHQDTTTMPLQNTMEIHTSSPDSDTTTSTAGTTAEYTTQLPSQRRKRFTEKTKSLPISKYDPNFLDPDDEDREFKDDEFTGPVDHSTKLEEIFRSLLMDLHKSERAYFGHNISDMLLSCTFEGRECTDNMFKLTQTAEYGNCWTMDSKKFKAKVSGQTGGLTLILNLESTDYFHGITNGYGMRLLVHEPGTFPFPSEDGHHISASFETSVGLRMIAIQREDDPYGQCDPDIAETFAEQMKLTYTRRACQMVCEIDAMVNKCGCFDDNTEELATRKNKTLKPCRKKRERECREGMRLNIARKQIDCHCPVPCTETAYEKSFSSRQWPTDSYAMVLLERVCERNPVVCKNLRSKISDKRAMSYNFLKLNVYYEDLNFENISEQPQIAEAQFVSDIGGALGLWIGLSILSLCEIFQLIIEICDYAYHKAAGKKCDCRQRQDHKKERRHSDSNMQYKHHGKNKDIERQWPSIHFNGHNNH